MITLENDSLVFRFPEVHERAVCSIEFERTLRIPDDGNDYPLPPGLGRFPLRHLDDFAQRVPPAWQPRGGVIMPMHQAEALWLYFGDGGMPYTMSRYPFAVKVATGKRCAITGEAWVDHLNQDPQDYVVLPEQPWLDGYAIAKGTIRQFVAMPLGEGYTVEEQLTGDAEHGGIQLMVFPMKAERYETIKQNRWVDDDMVGAAPLELMAGGINSAMGLAPGGRMQQEIYEDPYGLDAWDTRHFSRCFVTIANTRTWREITGTPAPTLPPTAADYSTAGLPWFDYTDPDAKPLTGSETLGSVKTVAEMGAEKGETPLPENDTAENMRRVQLSPSGASRVREMTPPSG